MSVEAIIFQSSQHWRRVLEFMGGAKQVAPKDLLVWPMMPDAKTRLLRATLILEEAIETVNALGFKLMYDGKNYMVDPDQIQEPDLIEIADGCADLSVVNIGTLVACGIPDSPLIRIVDENNLEKLGPGSSFNTFGKLVKPKGFVGPKEKIEQFIENLKM